MGFTDKHKHPTDWQLVIGIPELRQLQAEWQLREDVIEKDYVLGWLLTAISAEDRFSGWIFKGGTCLRKCYYETYRFSEDLDFTIARGAPEEPEQLNTIFTDISSWLFESAGIELVIDEKSFVRKQNRRGKPTTLGRITFRGPRNSPSPPKVKLDLTSDELLVTSTTRQPIFHSYSDATTPSPTISCYSIVELLGEKLRALAERCRPRDLYDIIHVYRHPDLLGRSKDVLNVLERKSAFAGIEAPTLDSIHDSEFRQEIQNEWENMLGHQLPELPPSPNTGPNSKQCSSG